METISRQKGPLYLELVPALGGTVRRFTWHGHDILRPLPDSASATVNQGGSFALVPYSNRIAHGQFEFSGHAYQLARNFGDHPHTIHGNAWQNPWQLSGLGEDFIELTMLHSVDGTDAATQCAAWPWPYHVVQRFTLRDDELHISLRYHNLAAVTVPVGLGFHPYFPRASEAEIQFTAEHVVLNGEDALPHAVSAIPERWDYRHWSRPQAGSVDNCFAHWDGKAAVRWPNERIMATISSSDAAHAILFIPPADRDFVAIEPVSHINDAINNHGFGDPSCAMHSLPAGAAFEITMSIKVCFYD
ncbi:aldose 1-epimerase [Plesiomonas shigelloides]|uniref:aldose 1-epimerase n=1 Tax=Plesiomonas shigelloides TaxID=703 RepID=UPI0012615FA9|nr:aldose 1-epimerase [Plesiomonas shigelloides]KAB7668775.1 aldose 1-epimerase [Plesiomonas shigelloides]